MSKKLGLPEELGENISEIDDANRFLKKNNASGVLIGGKAYAFVAGNHQIEIEQRKDLDLLVLNGGYMMSYNEDYDLFLPREDGAFRNVNNFTLPYHLHYTGKKLRPGLYLPPPEIIYLTECEMATRRAIDRVIPDIIAQRYSPLAARYNKISADDLILEFPGDFSWFGKSFSPFPIQLLTRKEGGGKRTFISTTWRSENVFPHTAFPDERDVRTPECNNYSSVLPEAVLTVEEIRKTGFELIKAKYFKEGISYLRDKSPELLDDSDILNTLFCDIEEYPLQCAEAFSIWLKTAIEKKFYLLFLLDEEVVDKYGCSVLASRNSSLASQCVEKIRELSSQITGKYGLRYADLAERLRHFSFKGLASGEVPEEFINNLKECYLDINFCDFRDSFKFKVQSGKKEDATIVLNGVFPVSLEAGKGLLFADYYYNALRQLGLTDEELVNSTCESIKEIFLAKHSEFEQVGILVRIGEKTIIEGGNTVLDSISVICETLDREKFVKFIYKLLEDLSRLETSKVFQVNKTRNIKNMEYLAKYFLQVDQELNQKLRAMDKDNKINELINFYFPISKS